MTVEVSPAMLACLYDILANAEPHQLEIEHTLNEEIVTGADALEWIADLYHRASRDLDE